jgi:uncharacterized protein (TIGR02246 family)
MSARNTAIVDEVNAAFAANNIEGFLAHCTDDVVWTMVGDRTVSGVDAIRNWMSSTTSADPPTFTVDHVSGDADTVTAYGDMTMKGDNGSPEPYAYCDVYRFRGDKIAELRSYVVSTKAK